MTQGDIAEIIDKTITTVGDYERGKSIPPLEIANQLCEIFEVDLNELVNKDLSQNPPQEQKKGPDDESPPVYDDKLFKQLLVLKLEEVSNRLKEIDPEAYDELRLDTLIDREKKKKGLK